MTSTTYEHTFGALIEEDAWFPSPAHLLRRSALLEEFSAFEGGDLLDIGCGAGRLLIDWQKLGHSGYGVDLDDGARSLSQNCVNAFQAPFKITKTPPKSREGSFDYLTIIEVLEHLEAPEDALKTWAKYLKPGGVLLASVPAFQSKWGASDEWAGHVQRFEPDAFRALIERAGFEVERVRLWGFPLGNLTRIAGNITSKMKMRGRETQLDRVESTLASGRDRSIENKVGKTLRSPFAAAILKAGIMIQRLFAGTQMGIGVIVVARKK